LSGIEQRKSKRYKLEKWVKAWVNEREINCRLIDISEKGLGVSKSGVLGIKSYDAIIIELEHVGKVYGVITWTGQISFGVSLKLDLIAERKMESFIKTLAGETLEVY